MGLLARGSTHLPEDRGNTRRRSASLGRGALLLGLFERDLLFKLIAVLLLYSLIPLGEIFLFVYIGSLLGNFLVLALALTAGISGALVALDQAHRALERLKEHAAAGKDLADDLVEMAGIILGAVLLLTPGFITDLCGYALFLPRVRAWAGRAVTKLLASQLGALSERLRPFYSLKIR
jgi:UPF0716 protein FxsA